MSWVSCVRLVGIGELSWMSLVGELSWGSWVVRLSIVSWVGGVELGGLNVMS